MSERRYLGLKGPDGVVVDAVHVTGLEDHCAPWLLTERALVNPYRAVVDGHGLEWHRLDQGTVDAITGERGGCCWCEIVAATRGFDPPVRATEATGTHVGVLPLRRDPQLWATVTVATLALVGAVALAVAAVIL